MTCKTVTCAPMRVLHVFKDYYPPTRGGIEQHIHDVTHSLAGYDFAVLTSSRSRRRITEMDDGVRVVRAPELCRPVSTPVTPSWARFLRNSGADLLHFHMPNPFGELEYLVARTSAPMVATYHADIMGRAALRPLFAPFQARFLRRCRTIIVSNPRLAETSKTLVEHRSKIEIIPFGIDPAPWALRPPIADEIRAKIPGPIILYLGRLARYKGVETLVEAMRGIDATCLIVGGGPRGRALKDQARSMNLRHKVLFVGEVSDEMRRAYYHAADIFVLPSTTRAEAFGISMLEAMACGTAVVSTELGTGTSWVNRHGETGLVVAPGNTSLLSGAIRSLLGDATRRAEMANGARQRVATHFTRDAMLKAISQVYASV